MSEIDYATLRMLASSNDGDPEWEPEVVIASAELNALLDELELFRYVFAPHWGPEYAVQWVETDGLPVTDIGADREDIAALVESQDGWAREVRRFVGPWVPVPEQNQEPKGSES